MDGRLIHEAIKLYYVSELRRNLLSEGSKYFWMIYSIIIGHSSPFTILRITLCALQQTRCVVANMECPEEYLEWFEILRADLHEQDETFFALFD
jgi:hypothetical protein